MARAMEMRPALKATVMRWMSCAVVRMVATAGSSAACRCTASAPHHAALQASVVVVRRASPLQRGRWPTTGNGGIDRGASRFPVRRVMRGRLSGPGLAATAAGPPTTEASPGC